MFLLISQDSKNDTLAVVAGICVPGGEQSWKHSREVDQKEAKEQVKDFLLNQCSISCTLPN